jgi:hypothetical protein
VFVWALQGLSGVQEVSRRRMHSCLLQGKLSCGIADVVDTPTALLLGDWSGARRLHAVCVGELACCVEHVSCNRGLASVGYH